MNWSGRFAKSEGDQSVLAELIELSLSLTEEELRECGYGSHATLTDFLIQLRRVVLRIGKKVTERACAEQNGEKL